ncbi:unnamed protein product [Rotaria sp. Silwood1]|nr:unnamed protein product [Rotaria sp. Silwood1]CAF0835624.1 unnamed protein product [Rotaria sp. Silwood1]CAF3366666.1 unnamed protein product [Rotaria sp. Silwood1]CAF3399524.1 unnamed protein product [Rotaria sp. Silwood1]CAF4725526.1 unnamed protein product [Rotaria sp. Silwood1]
MTLSIKKRFKSATNIASIGNDDSNALGEVLHRSTKTSKSAKKSKKSDQFLHPGHTICTDSDFEIKSRSSSVERSVTYKTRCPCETHYDKQLVERNYALIADKLFDLIFGKNEFVRTYRQAQRIYDDTATEWAMNEETKCQERVLTYKVPLESTLIGKGIISTREKQTILHKEPGSHYIVETEVFNEGVKYSDTFSLAIRYCIVQTSVTTTHLRVTAHVRFCKSLMGFIKQIIERNAYSASQESFKDLNNRLHLVSNFKKERRRSSRGELTLPVPLLTNAEARRMSRHDALGITPLNQTMNYDDKNHYVLSIFSNPNKTIYLFIFITAFLLLIHLYLYLKLKHMDVLVDSLTHLIKLSSSSSAKRRS